MIVPVVAVAVRVEIYLQDLPLGLDVRGPREGKNLEFTTAIGQNDHEVGVVAEVDRISSTRTGHKNIDTDLQSRRRRSDTERVVETTTGPTSSQRKIRIQTAKHRPASRHRNL